MNKLIFLILIILSVFDLTAQNDKFITGYAPEFIGETVTLYTYDDYLTMTRIKIGETVVEKDSLFKIKNNVKSTIKTIIEIGKTETELYLMPNTDYSIEYFKPINAPITFANQKVEVVFYDLDSTDVNYRVLQYDQWLDRYIYYNQFNIIKHGFSPYLDTFKIYAYDSYKYLDAPYFINYVRYNIAIMERTKVSSKMKSSKANTYLEYIHPYPVYAHNDQYMQFVKSFYPKDFEGYLPRIKSAVYIALDNESPTRLMAALKYDPILQIEELREMMMVNMLGNSYYKRGYLRSSIATILDSVSRFSKYKPNAVAAHNMLDYLTKLENGYPAPEINLLRDNGDVVNWATYKGKFVYVNFFASWNQISVTEMKLIKGLKEKYGEYISFISFSTDKTQTDFDAFMTEHEDYNWDIFYLSENHLLLEQFNIAAVPAYFLIDQDGYIALAPAKSPSPNGVYKSIDETFYYIKTEIDRQQPRH